MVNNRFIISTDYMEGGEKIGELYFKGQYTTLDGHCFHFAEYLYEKKSNKEEHLKKYLQEGAEYITKLKGEFCFVDYNIKRNEIVIVSDRFGKESPFIYDDEKKIIITNDFWESVRVVKPEEKDINWLTIKSLIVVGNTGGEPTLLKNMKKVRAAAVTKINLISHEITVSKYWYMRFVENPNLTLEMAAKRMDQLYDETFEILAEKFPKDTKFGIGFSGGQDSRLCAHYAKKHGMEIVPYCIGQKYRVFPIKTNGYRIVKKMAKHFGFKNFKFIERGKNDYLYKLVQDVMGAPHKSQNYIIGNVKEVPDFDIMINGEHGGVFQGEFDYEGLLSVTLNNMSDYLMSFLGWKDAREDFFSEEEYKQVKEQVETYVKSLNSTDKHEIFYTYFFEIYGGKSKLGFFETLYDTKERYSPFLNPDFVDFFLTWDKDFLVNRTIQRAFFMQILPELSKMPDESADAPLYWRTYHNRNVVRRFYYGVKHVLLGGSLNREKWLLKDRDYKLLRDRVLNANSDVMKKYFPGFNMTDKSNYKKARPTAGLVKMLVCVDCMLNCTDGNYEQFIVNKYSK